MIEEEDLTKIDIIGAGNIGETLTRRFRVLGHEVFVVMKLVDQLGFDAVDAGTLDDSWRQQPDTPVYAADFHAEGVGRAWAEASRKRPSEFQATGKGPGRYAKPA